MKYILIPMNKISDEAREIAVSWMERWSPGFNIDDKHKLASDIMNYANRRVKDIAVAYGKWLMVQAIFVTPSEESFQQFILETYKQ
jgi:hypothetical protein